MKVDCLCPRCKNDNNVLVATRSSGRMRFSVKKVTALFIAITLVICWKLFYSNINNLQQKTKLKPKDWSGNEIIFTEHYIKDSDEKSEFKTFKQNSNVNIIDIEQSGRLREYCNPIDSILAGKEGEAPDGYQLEIVHTIIRHGDRTPIHSVKNSPGHKHKCKISQVSTIDRELLQFVVDLQKQPHVSSDFPGWDLFPDNEECAGAQLTPRGAQQHLQIGKHLHKKYKGKLFSHNITGDDILVWSTSFTRTYQSAIALIYGFTSKVDTTKFQIKKSNSLFFCSQRSGLLCNCPMVYRFRGQADNNAGRFSRNDTSHIMLMQKLAKIYSVNAIELPWLTSIMDSLMGSACHQLGLPCNGKECIDEGIVEDIWKVIDKDGEVLKLKNKFYLMFSHFGLHPLLSEIMLRTKEVIAGNKHPLFVLYSGHDVTIQPLATVLGFHDGKWPPYASKIVIELYSKNSLEYFIKVLYNGVDQTGNLSFCKNSLFDGLCKFEHFEQFVNTHLQQFEIKSYHEMCSRS